MSEILLTKHGHKKWTEYTQTPRHLELNENHLYALEFIYRHTMASTVTLHHLMKGRLDTKRRDRFMVTFIPDLFDGGYIYRPEIQNAGGFPYAKYDVYMLTDKAKRLFDYPVVKHSGPFQHQLMGATFTGTIDIMCRRNGYRFIPAHEILKGTKKKLELPFQWHTKDGLKTVTGKYAIYDPDYIYGIDYGSAIVLFVPEFNRNTEPIIASGFARRSDLKTIRQVKKLFADYKVLFETKHPLHFQFVTINEHHALTFLELAKEEKLETRNVMTNFMPSFGRFWKPAPEFQTHLFEEPWFGRGYVIKKPASKGG